MKSALIFGQVSIATLLLLTLGGCDAVEKEEGIILDATTYKPISGVLVSEGNDDRHSTRTDSFGHYEYNKVSFPHHLRLTFNKDGYRTVERYSPSETNNELHLTRLDSNRVAQ
jgi:hypothetical protein